MVKRTTTVILLSIVFLLASCGPTPSQAPEAASAPIPGPVVPIGEPEVRDLGPTTETVWNCGEGGGMVVKHPSMSVVTGHAVEWEVGGTMGVGVHIGEGPIPGGVELRAALEGHYVTGFDQSIQQSTAWDLPAEPNTVVVYTLMWREVWQPGYVEVRLADQSIVRVNVRYRTGIQSEIVGKRAQVCEGEQQPAATQPIVVIPTATPVLQDTTPRTACSPQVGWTPPRLTSNGEWIYDCLSSDEGNWVGQTESWKAENWKRGAGQREIVNIVVPVGVTKMGLGCNPCTVTKPDGSKTPIECLSPTHCFGPFEPNLNIDVKPGEVHRVEIFGSDTCPSRPEAVPPCAPEIYIWFNLQ